jgi:alcohol dehydrogenase
VTACTGIDALGHAVETAVTSGRTEFSQVFSTAAFGLIVANFPRVLERPDDVEARGLMLRAAAFAGIAIENSMLGAAHSMANPLTANYGIDHGQAVGMCLPAVVRFNQVDPEAAKAYADLARGARLCEREESVDDAVTALVLSIESLLSVAGFESSLSACGVPKTAAQDLADEAMHQWTAQFNPRPITAADFGKLFAVALD